MKRASGIAVALVLVLAGTAALGCGAGYGTGNVYVGVGVGPYVGYPYPYAGPYGGWVGRPYPSPYRWYDFEQNVEGELGSGTTSVSDSTTGPAAAELTNGSAAN
jgi:hypothetical protein